MPLEKSAGAIIFRKQKEPLFLLLLYPSAKTGRNPYWDFTKGHLEKGENETEALKREVKEETGLEKIKLIPGFKETIRYFFVSEGQKIIKTVVFYLAEAESDKIEISSEHLDYKWLDYENALNLLNFKNAKEILEKANLFLKRKPLF